MGIGVGIALAALQGLSTYQAGRSEAAAYEAQAKTDEQNARIAERQREDINLRALEERKRLEAKASAIQGENTASFGAAGIDSTSGTAQALTAANQDALNTDLGILDYNLATDDYGLRQNIANLEYFAKSKRAAAKSAKRGALFNSILSTAMSIYGLEGMKGASKGMQGTDKLTMPNFSYTYESPFTPKNLFSTGANNYKDAYKLAKWQQTPSWRLKSLPIWSPRG